MSDLAILGWGMMIGWLICRWRDRKPTVEHEIGEGFVKAFHGLVDAARFVGKGMIVERRWTTTTKHGRFTVRIEREDA